MKPTYQKVYIQRRSEAMAELFLEELGAVARSTDELGYDYLVTVKGKHGRVNTFGIEVKGTESNPISSFRNKKELYRSLTFSNIPGFLLVVDVKNNRLYYGWPDHVTQTIPLHEVNQKTTTELRKRLVDW